MRRESKRARSLCLALLIAVVGALGITGSASASFAQWYYMDICGGLEPWELHYTAVPGEVNKLLMVALDAEEELLPFGCVAGGGAVGASAVLISDPGATIIPGPGCRRITKRQVVCERNLPPVVTLGDQGDYLALDLLTPGARVDSGPGDDHLRIVNLNFDRVDCGDGNDTVTADASDALVNCENVTRIIG